MYRRAIFAACLLLISNAAAAASPANAEITTRQAPSCGEWIVHREKSDTLALGNASWLLGLLSGIALGSGKDFLAGTDNSSIFSWMDRYCRSNPLRDLVSGGNALAAELAGAKRTPK